MTPKPFHVTVINNVEGTLRAFHSGKISFVTYDWISALQAGDTREMVSIWNVFAKSHSIPNSLVVSSIKGNIGYCGAATGAAGLAKLLPSLRNNKLSRPQLNPRLGDLNTAGIVMPLKLRTWTKLLCSLGEHCSITLALQARMHPCD